MYKALTMSLSASGDDGPRAYLTRMLTDILSKYSVYMYANVYELCLLYCIF